ncbi:Abi family protein [Clostridium algidicarnis]|uniref:Abi family protein n=1 Tax=Clostridium algidicarnis TaxID=37659 RepID=UPI00162941A2|nr:Abi family protein [Clostridium algidicarnis]MBB6697273.1 Abi family protein [Clostridium algidicarnis]
MKVERRRDIKKAKSFKEQIEILKSRNIIIENDDFAISILKRVNYYRLSAYMLTYKNTDGNYNNISIEEVYNLYLFDKRLRNLILPMLENIEIAFRTHISYLIAHKYGALGYKEPNNFRNAGYHKEMIDTFNYEIDRSDEIFVSHHKSEYNGVFPIWVLIEVSSFGTLSKMYNNLLDEDKDEIADKYYNAKGEYVRTWLHALSNIRNRCAHYGRLYNKNLTVTPKLFRSDRKKGIKNHTIFANIYIIGRLSRDKFEWSHFVTKLSALIEMHDVVDLKYLGFPDDWETILRNIQIN